MKKKFIIVMIMIVIIVSFVVIGKVWIDMNNAIPYSILTGVDEYKIKDYITSIYESNNENIKTFVAIKNLKTEVNEENYKVRFYAWIITENYYEKNGEIKRVSRDSKPYKFTLYNTIVEQCEFPKEDSDYTSTLKQIFPEDVIMQISIIDETELELEIERQINLYYNKNQEYDNSIEVNNIVNDIKTENYENNKEIHITI